MTLLERLVQELPKLGGWPSDRTVASNGLNGSVTFHSKVERLLLWLGYISAVQVAFLTRNTKQPLQHQSSLNGMVKDYRRLDVSAKRFTIPVIKHGFAPELLHMTISALLDDGLRDRKQTSYLITRL